MRVIETHLTPAMRERLGAPDVRLVVAEAAFPVHSSYITAHSGVLSSLLKGCDTQGDVVLCQVSRGNMCSCCGQGAR